MTVPKAGASAARRAESISPSTQSVGIKVDGGTEQFFNATPASAGCTAGEGGTTCTFNVTAPVGSDTFIVTAYSRTGGAGAVLDTATLTATVTANQTTPVAITLGPVVSITADSGPGSLRQAVADANPGDTVTVALPAPATITLTGGIIAILKNLTLSGPSSGTITINAGRNSQIFSIASNATVTLSNLTLTAAASGGGSNGGAIDDAGTLTLNSMQITNSSAGTSNLGYRGGPGSTARTAPPDPNSRPKGRRKPLPVAPGDANGGAVAVEEGASLTVSNSTFSSDTGYEGGAIWTSSGGGTLTVTGSTFTGNATTSTNSGSYGYGGAIYNAITTTLTNDTFTNNDGSAVAAYAPATTVSGGTFSNNKAGGYSGYGYGGALYLEGPATIANVTFSGNSAGDPTTEYAYGYGGALYSDYDVTITGSTFTANTAGTAGYGYGYGGAIYSDDGDLTVTGTTFTSNIAGATSSATPAASASPPPAPEYGYGGAISDETGNTATITGDTFTGNTAGGTEYGYGGAVDIDAYLTLTNDTFSQNEAFGTGSDGYAYGGAVNFNGNNGSLANSTYTNNVAAGNNTPNSNGYAYAGALYVDAGGTADLSGDTFTGNSATGAEDAYGGAVDTETPITMTGGNFANNTSAVGTGACSYAEGGGAVFDGDATLSGVTVTGNHSAATGTSTGCSSTLARTPSRHHARKSPNLRRYQGNDYPEPAYGGGIESDDGVFSFSNGTLTNNVAATDGGGLYLDSSSAASITASTISGNSVTGSPGYSDGGGGVFTNTAGTTITTTTITGNTVAGSTDGNDGGGGIYARGALTMSNDTATANSAQFGGDIFSESNVSLAGVTLMSGTATASNGAGGDYYGDPSTSNSLTVFATIVAGGTASTQNNLGGTIAMTDQGYNLFNTGNGSINGSSDFDITGATVDPLLLPLANNGGATQTMADQATSPGKDFIPYAQCQSMSLTEDQRNYGRSDAGDLKCDIGAFEFGATGP